MEDSAAIKRFAAFPARFGREPSVGFGDRKIQYPCLELTPRRFGER